MKVPATYSDEEAFGKLYQHLSKISREELSYPDKMMIAGNCRLQVVKRQHFCLREGEINRYMFFIVSGSMRMFTRDERGREHVMCLKVENSWIYDHESFQSGTKSRYAIEALEDSRVIKFNVQKIAILKATIFVFKKTLELNNFKDIIEEQKRAYWVLRLSAPERLKQLVQTNPNFLERFSQNLLASYLGITFETLSRVKKNCAL